jgi:hypothetical protein
MNGMDEADDMDGVDGDCGVASCAIRNPDR